jgi:metal-responsive CopG/Arc/MetJ family transcriptional regulator
MRQRVRPPDLWIASRYDDGYTATMKTAISIPDTIFQQAEKAAQQMKMSRSELYTKAVASFLERHHAQDITGKLNEVYAKEASALAPEFAAAQAAALATEDW